MPLVFDIGSPDSGRVRRNYRRSDAPRHNHRWDRAEEDTLLLRFESGESIGSIAREMGRTPGAINSRLGLLMGIAYPYSPEQYRRDGRPIRRRAERRTMPREANAPQSVQVERMRFIESPPNISANAIEGARITAEEVDALNYATPAAAIVDGTITPWHLSWGDPVPPPDMLEVLNASAALAVADHLATPQPARSRIHRVRTRPVRSLSESAAPPPVAEVPDHLIPNLMLSPSNRKGLAAEIKGIRPATREGRTAAAQHSAVNRLAYRLAAIFEVDDPTFDRAKWLEACGVTKEN